TLEQPNNEFEKDQNEATVFAKAVDLFLDFVWDRTQLVECSEPLEVFRHETPCTCFELASLTKEREDVLWLREGEFEIRLCGVVSNYTYDDIAHEIAFISIDGNCTTAALRGASREAAEVLRQVIGLAKTLSDV